MKIRSAVVLGFLVASAIPALQFVILSLIFNTQIHSAVLSEKLLFSVISFLVSYPYSILFTVVFGVPIFLIARRFGLVTWWSALGAGALVGILVSVIMRSPSRTYAADFLEYVPVATISAFVFWLIWKQGRDPIKASSS